MNWNLVKKTVSDRWRGTLVYGVGLAAWTLMLTAIFPSFKNMSGLNELIERYPENIYKLFGGAELDFTDFDNFITVEFLGLMIVIIVGAFVFTFARSIVAGELKEGTLELLLAQPVERWRVVVSKGAVMLAGIVGLVLVVIVSVFVFGSAFKVGVSYSGYLAYWPLGVCLFVAIGGYTTLLSILNPRRGVMAAVAVTLAFYLMNFVAETVGFLKVVKYFSIFHYYNPGEVLGSGSVPWLDMLFLAGLGVACFAAALWFFERKDIVL